MATPERFSHIKYNRTRWRWDKCRFSCHFRSNSPGKKKKKITELTPISTNTQKSSDFAKSAPRIRLLSFASYQNKPFFFGFFSLPSNELKTKHRRINTASASVLTNLSRWLTLVRDCVIRLNWYYSVAPTAIFPPPIVVVSRQFRLVALRTVFSFALVVLSTVKLQIVKFL